MLAAVNIPLSTAGSQEVPDAMAKRTSGRKGKKVYPGLEKAWAARRRNAARRRAAKARGESSSTVTAGKTSKSPDRLTGSAAAKALGISKVTLYRRLKIQGIRTRGTGITPDILDRLRSGHATTAARARTSTSRRARGASTSVPASEIASSPDGMGAIAKVIDRRLGEFLELLRDHLKESRRTPVLRLATD